MRLITKLLITGLLMLSLPLGANAALNEKQLAQELKQAENNKNAPNQAEIVETLQSALNWLNESKESISDFPKLTRELRQQLSDESTPPLPASAIPANEAEQQILQISSQLLEVSRQLQQELDRSREISDSLGQVPQKQATARKDLTEAERRLQNLT
ncbi:MAG: miniconductance mechanosensitive channel MscM, partial [Hafnia sp.]